MDKAWYDYLKSICDRYDIEMDSLGDIINDPKVIPMLRGKSFEFFVAKKLREILPATFQVSNPRLNAQGGEHDIDVQIINPSGKQFRVECKLAKKGSFKKETNEASVLVKCMRSRTLGAERAAQVATSLGLPTDVLLTHNDQYRPADFDLVITSIGNAFYETDADGLYYWSPDENSSEFFRTLQIQTQLDAYSSMYFAFSNKISCENGNGATCSRKKCQHKNTCGFIPNYPKITFNYPNFEPAAPWHPLSKIIEYL